MPEAKGTVKQMNQSGKSWLMEEFDCVWSKGGKNYDGPPSFMPGDKVTVVYDEVINADGKSSFFVTSAWPTTGPARDEPTGGPPPRPEPAGPTPPPEPDSYEGYQAAGAGPPRTPPSRENSILFQVCLKAAQEWVMGHETLAKTPAEVLNVADVYYGQGLRLISGQGLALDGPEQPQDGDPGPGEPA